MASLANVLSALQREMGSALAQGLQLPSGVSLKAERAVVTLRFGVHEKPGGEIQFPCSGTESGESSTAHPHTLTIEFGAEGPSESGPVAQRLQNSLPKLLPKNGAQAGDQLKASLSLIFGAPGFDSAARATVFREAFADLSPEQAQTVIDSISGPAPENDDSAKRSRMLLLKLVRSAPLESPEEGIAILTEVFRHHALSSILSLVAREWKTQEDWL